MSVSSRFLKSKVLETNTINDTTDLSPVVPGAVNVSGPLEPGGVATATPMPQAGSVSQTALPIPGSINVTSPHGDAESPATSTAKFDRDGCPI